MELFLLFFFFLLLLLEPWRVINLKINSKVFDS